jgi:hypothetical protein
MQQLRLQRIQEQHTGHLSLGIQGIRRRRPWAQPAAGSARQVINLMLAAAVRVQKVISSNGSSDDRDEEAL